MMENDNQRLGTDAVAAHGWRVAAWCVEVAQRLQLDRLECDALEEAAITYQQSKLVVVESVWKALCADLGIAVDEVRGDLAWRILQRFHGQPGVSGEGLGRLVSILEACIHLDNACEFDARVSGDPDVNGLDDAVGTVAEYLRGVPNEGIAAGLAGVPVFPGVAARAHKLLGDEVAAVEELERLIGNDQILAASIIRAANMATFARPVNTIRKAVMRIGAKKAQQVIAAAALRSVFDVQRYHPLWDHSLDIATTAVSLAEKVGSDPGEAFLAGLVHDIGKLVLLSVSAEPRECHSRLTRKGCPDVIVERVVFGKDHAALGGELLRLSCFPEEIAAAVEYHHTPERAATKLCCMLYLAEQVLGRDEGLQSKWREELLESVLGIRHATRGERDAVLGSLRFAA